MASAPAGVPLLPPRRRPPWPWIAALCAVLLLAAVGNGLCQRRPLGRSQVVEGPVLPQGAVSAGITYVASLQRYPHLANVPDWAMPAYVKAPVFFRRLFDEAYGFFVPHFRRPAPGQRFFEIVLTGRAPAGSQPGFGLGRDPVLAAGDASTRLEQIFWREPGSDGVYHLRLLFSLSAKAQVAQLTLTIAGEELVLAVPEP